jgi:putative peptide zinc metalloprotease protein
VSNSLFSPSWYRVARLKPRIRSHAQFHRHLYRGQLWYVLQDHSSGRFHRLTPAAYHLVGLMNGERTTQEIWDAANTQLGDDGPTQDETIRLFGLLHFADVLQCDVPPDTVEILRRSQRREHAEWWRRWLNPLSLRVPLVDPDRFLERWLPLVRPLLSQKGAAAWCLAVAGALLLAAANWSQISSAPTEQLLDPRNLVVLWIVYPLVKALHELGHAFAAKAWGGEVHEMGVMFLVFVPIPYVDASSASAFPDKWQRVLVSSAGILVELFLAATALFVWLTVEPGLVRSVAYNVMWIGGASTLFFNGNPLLRFDGYYVLADAVEIPNLGNRSTQYIGYLAQRYGCGLENVRCPVSAPGEEAWFVGYGVASFVYRLGVLFAIALFLSKKLFVVGVLLALFAVGSQIVFPLLRHMGFLLTSPRLAANRARAIGVWAGAFLSLAGLLFLLPMPLFTRAEGVVWPPEGSEVRARADGFVVELLREPDSIVQPGEPLVLTRDPSLEAEVAVLEARVRELRALHHAEKRITQVKAQITLEQLAMAEAALARARERAGEVVIRSVRGGAFISPRASSLKGLFVKQGELIGYVVDPPISTARVVVPQSDIALVRDRTQGVEVRLSSRIAEAVPARILRLVPAATDLLPSRALGTTGGGRIPVDPVDADGLRTLDSVFQLELAIAAKAAAEEMGGRVYVRFDHGAEPFALRVYRSLRRLFLRQLGV